MVERGSHATDDDAADALTLAIVALGAYQAKAALPNETGAAIALGQTFIASSELVPSLPFSRARNAWREAATDLEGMAEEISALTAPVNGGTDELWEGEGAEAFGTYVEEMLIPAINALAEACQTASGLCDEISDRVFWALLDYVALAIFGALLGIAARQLLGVPPPGLGAALHRIAVIAGYLTVAYEVYQTLRDLVQGLMDSTATYEALAMEMEKRLGGHFGREGERLEKARFEKEHAEIESVLENPDKWDKSE